ncbi:histidine kinase [Flammeovirgaceae bacterium SG7u.111]|nr:histidine kinase [Flammeovirgaceae bacterium SG7u.132]WPO33420.1 histidine kinase [Flammeovirgaceae bacterium SG7u.111]
MTNEIARDRFEKLGRRYILALLGIAIAIISSQLLIQTFISRQKDDSRVVNVAGRQRMLSQKISKLALKLRLAKAEGHSAAEKELEEAVVLWKTSHEALLYGNEEMGITDGNSQVIEDKFKEIALPYNQMLQSANSLLDHANEKTLSSECQEAIDNILKHESAFLKGMDEIVFLYDDEAKAKVGTLSTTELILLTISLLIILFEIIFIFKPTAKNVGSTIEELIRSEKTAKSMAREIGVLYNTLEESYQQLADTGGEPELPTLFMRTTREGDMLFIPEKSLKTMECGREEFPKNVFQWFIDEGYSPDFVEKVKGIVARERSWNGEIKVTTGEGDFLWLDIHLVPVGKTKYQSQQIMVACANVTDIKEAKERSIEINKARIEEQVKKQQFRSVLILEGQEEERKRIARDMHDGVGQMLYGMQLNLESLMHNSPKALRSQLSNIQELLTNVIREVRRVSFNLTPSSLSDFGIGPAIKKYCTEVSKLMGIDIIFENRDGFINRLDKNVEIHLYRIVQEAINNAIKYASAKNIDVLMTYDYHNLSIEVTDNGKGFDYDRLNRDGYFAESGHGLFNMQERTSFFNGSFAVDSKIGRGTTIKVNLPIN